MIKGFSEFSLDAPGCHPGATVYKAYFKLLKDVSEFFPYINATVENAVYHEKPHHIQFSLDKHRCALYPDEVHIAGFENRDQAIVFFEEFCTFLNDIWDRKASIAPDHTTYKPIPVMDIFKCLPRTNCKDCGYTTCMAYAAAVSQQEVGLDQCPDLNKTGNKNTEQLQAMGLGL